MICDGGGWIRGGSLKQTEASSRLKTVTLAVAWTFTRPGPSQRPMKLSSAYKINKKTYMKTPGATFQGCPAASRMPHHTLGSGLNLLL